MHAVLWLLLSLAAGSAATQERPVIRSRADLVTSDITVRDKTGRFVADLAPSDFEIWEDGVPQKLVTMVVSVGGRIRNQMEAAATARPADGIVIPQRPGGGDTPGRVFVIFLDDLHLGFRETGGIRALVKMISDELIHEGDLFAMVSTGPSSIEIDPTYDRARLDRAIGRIAGNGLRVADIVSGPRGDGHPEARHRAHVAFRTALDMLRQLEGVRTRRKAFIYVSNGYDLDPLPAATLPGGDPFARTSGVFAEAELAAQLAELTRAANRANATIYTIDPRGLDAGPDIDQQVNPIAWQNHLTRSRNSLRVLADLTGGFAAVDRNDFKSALARIHAETSDYYVLGYYSSNTDASARRRRIEVKVKRPGLTVHGRSEYVLPPQSR